MITQRVPLSQADDAVIRRRIVKLRRLHDTTTVTHDAANRGTLQDVVPICDDMMVLLDECVLMHHGTWTDDAIAIATRCLDVLWMHLLEPPMDDRTSRDARVLQQQVWVDRIVHARTHFPEPILSRMIHIVGEILHQHAVTGDIRTNHNHMDVFPWSRKDAILAYLSDALRTGIGMDGSPHNDGDAHAHPCVMLTALCAITVLIHGHTTPVDVEQSWTPTLSSALLDSLMVCCTLRSMDAWHRSILAAAIKVVAGLCHYDHLCAVLVDHDAIIIFATWWVLHQVVDAWVPWRAHSCLSYILLQCTRPSVRTTLCRTGCESAQRHWITCQHPIIMRHVAQYKLTEWSQARIHTHQEFIRGTFHSTCAQFLGATMDMLQPLASYATAYIPILECVSQTLSWYVDFHLDASNLTPVDKTRDCHNVPSPSWSRTAVASLHAAIWTQPHHAQRLYAFVGLRTTEIFFILMRMGIAPSMALEMIDDASLTTQTAPMWHIIYAKLVAHGKEAQVRQCRISHAQYHDQIVRHDKNPMCPPQDANAVDGVIGEDAANVPFDVAHNCYQYLRIILRDDWVNAIETERISMGHSPLVWPDLWLERSQHLLQLHAEPCVLASAIRTNIFSCDISVNARFIPVFNPGRDWRLMPIPTMTATSSSSSSSSPFRSSSPSSSSYPPSSSSDLTLPLDHAYQLMQHIRHALHVTDAQHLIFHTCRSLSTVSEKLQHIHTCMIQGEQDFGRDPGAYFYTCVKDVLWSCRASLPYAPMTGQEFTPVIGFVVDASTSSRIPCYRFETPTTTDTPSAWDTAIRYSRASCEQLVDLRTRPDSRLAPVWNLLHAHWKDYPNAFGAVARCMHTPMDAPGTYCVPCSFTHNESCDAPPCKKNLSSPKPFTFQPIVPDSHPLHDTLHTILQSCHDNQKHHPPDLSTHIVSHLVLRQHALKLVRDHARPFVMLIPNFA